MHRKFQRMGLVADAPCSGKPDGARTKENQYAVAQAVVEDSRRSTRRSALQLGISHHYLQIFH